MGSESRSVRAVLCAGAMAAALAVGARAQCTDWAPGLHAAGVTGLVVFDQIVFDDGTGPALYVGGIFTHIGSVAAPGIARWDGHTWTALGAPGSSGGFFNSSGVYALAVYDDGGGPALFIGGDFTSISGVSANNIAKWTGSTWQPLGTGANNGVSLAVNALCVFDNGSGARLYAGGYFDSAGNVAQAAGVASWDGSDWFYAGNNNSFVVVNALEVFDDGSGPQLYAAGSMPFIGGVQVNDIARGDGTSWSPVGSGFNDVVFDLCVYDDPLPGGPRLIAAGGFSSAGSALARRVAQWDGTNWSGIGGGVGQVYDLAETVVAHDDGTGSKLYVGGEFHSAGGNPVNNIASWDGFGWSSDVTLPGFDRLVFSLASFDDGTGNPSRLVAGGNFDSSAGPVAVVAAKIAAWDGSNWSALVGGTGVDKTVYALAEHDDGTGAALYAGGSFAFAGAAVANRIAKWTASAGWSPVGNGIGADDDVLAFASWDEGTGGPARLFAAGRFVEIEGVTLPGIARWDGAQWSGLGAGLRGGEATGYALATYDDGGGEALYVAGGFQRAGNVNASRIAKWDGAAWSPLGAGLDKKATALARFDDGGGEQLYVAGNFGVAGTLACEHIARWDGTTWSDVGGGTDGSVLALAVFDDGTGPALYAAGSFTHAGGLSAQRIARWNGLAWSSVGAGFANGQVNELAAFSDCNGRALYAGGTFDSSGGAPVKCCAKWDGSQWVALGSGVDTAGGSVEALLAYEDGLGFGLALWVGGNFTQIDGEHNPYLARWARACDGPQSFCAAGASANGCVPALVWSGSPSAAGSTAFDVSAINVDGQRSGLLFYGTSGAISSPWGSTSLLCVKAPTQRTPLHGSNGSAGACNGVLTLGWNAYLVAHPAAQGAPFSAGDDVWIQAWYRDPATAKTTRLSNALRFQVCP